jgi:hypothetical protein
MKIAAGCFGCLAFVFLILSFTTGYILTAIANASPDAYSAIAPVAGFANYINSGCCCLSGVMAIVLLAVGSMGKKNEEIE